MGDTTTPHQTSLSWHLKTLKQSNDRKALCTSVLPVLVDAIAAIAQTLHSSHEVAQIGSANAFGDDQLNVDVSSEATIREKMSKCPSVVTASSEEDPIERPIGEHAESQEGEEVYTIGFDPLDGSSIIAPNWSVGTIVGIWDGRTALHQSPDEKLIAAVLGIYGPRTTAVIALRIPGAEPVCLEIGISCKGSTSVTIVRPDIKLSSPPFKTRYFAPANLRAAAEDEKYASLINHYISNKYTLRYSGGLIPDCVHALIKGHGVYVSPVTEKSDAKLRRLFELLPVALVVECAGGMAIDPVDGTRILDKSLEDINEKGGLICGNREEVEFVIEKLLD